VAIIHRTVRWCTGLSGGAPDCPVSQRRQQPTVVRAINARHVVRANGPGGPTVSCARYGRRSCTGLLQELSGGALDCPVHHSTEGKNCVPNWSPTAPSCLGAIKGTPWRMEQYTKLFKKHPKTPRICIRAIRSSFLRFEHCSSCRLLELCLCAHFFTRVCVCAADLGLACVALPSLLLCFLCDHNFVRVRGSNL
jgi:hypothetical protein